ncbi:MAG TPA: ComEC/Rec2 family competence protein [Ilumatobacteraceae bacterium]|nr:ComEC/Rec2 family competence protein [Ilumatobacteraceae bacterium]
MTGPDRRHQISDAAILMTTVTLVVAVWQGLLMSTLALACVVLLRQRPFVILLCACVAVIGSWAATRAWEQATPRHVGAYTGWVEIVADPTPYGAGLRVTVEIDDERFDAWIYGGARRKLADCHSGQFVWVEGSRTGLGSNARRAQVRHVVGRFQLTVTGDVIDGSPLARANNRVRGRLRGVAESTMTDVDAALFTGLVIGDDARQPGWMVDNFRASGLSHLTAVSGQNVAFVLAGALPLLRRLRPWWRWGATVALIVWFMALTRFEPSVLRAGVMAVLAATAYVRGQQVRPVRVLSLAVLGLVLVDPLLVWSVGFWLSVGATLGVCVVGPWLALRLPGPEWLRLPMAVTLGAQVGVVIPSLLVFGRLPIVSLPANLAAVPAAGFVMLYGLPAGLLASLLPSALQPLVMLPATVGTRWVSTVASVAAAVEPSPMWATLWWSAALSCLLAWWWWTRSRLDTAGVPI